MSEKRFVLWRSEDRDGYTDEWAVDDKLTGKRIDEDEVVDLLNEQSERIKSLEMELDLIANTKLFSRRKLEEDNEQLKKQLSACKEGQQNLMEEHRNDEEALDKIWNIIKELYGSD